MEIKVIVRDKNTLVLEQDAKKGDLIRIDQISNVDLAHIQHLLETALNQETEKRIREAVAQKERELQGKNEAEILKRLEKSKQEWEEKKRHDIQQISDRLEKKEKDYQETRTKLQSLQDAQEANLKNERLQAQISYQKQLDEKESRIQQLIEQQKQDEERFQQEKDALREKTSLEKDNEFAKEKEKLTQDFRDQLESLKNENAQLKNAKAALNVKRIGENLEQWCDGEVRSYMQNGFQNCRWTKDNAVVREGTESHGSKADFLFSIYASEKKEEQELLTSICLDMKDENPDSVNRKSNSDYYPQLDSNRRKKKCKYAVLVSNLELDKPNDIPIFRVPDYPDMYVVRPAFLMTFLNMIVSLTTRFAELTLREKDKTTKELAFDAFHKEFEELKTTYLDKPLEVLEKDLALIRKQNKAILDAGQKVEEALADISRRYVEEIKDKIDRLSTKLFRAERAYQKEIA